MKENLNTPEHRSGNKKFRKGYGDIKWEKKEKPTSKPLKRKKR